MLVIEILIEPMILFMIKNIWQNLRVDLSNEKSVEKPNKKLDKLEKSINSEKSYFLFSNFLHFSDIDFLNKFLSILNEINKMINLSQMSQII